MPAFSLYNNNGSIFAVVSQGSGSRSAPLFADSSYDYDAIYNIYDKDVARTDLYNYDSVKNPLITKNIKVDNVSGLRLINDDKRKDNTDGRVISSIMSGRCHGITEKSPGLHLRWRDTGREPDAGFSCQQLFGTDNDQWH